MNKKLKIIFGGVRNSASLRSLPRLRLGHITADKREIRDFPKLCLRHNFAYPLVRRNANAIFRKGVDSMSTVKEKELKRRNQKEKRI